MSDITANVGRKRAPERATAPERKADRTPEGETKGEAKLNPSPAVETNALGDPTVPDPGNNNAETIVPDTDPYVGSAAQLGDGNLGDTDVQWPPGRIETAAAAFATADPGTRVIDGPGRTDPSGPHPVNTALDARADQG